MMKNFRGLSLVLFFAKNNASFVFENYFIEN